MAQAGMRARTRTFAAVVLSTAAAFATSAFALGELSASELREMSLEELMELEVRTVHAASKHEQKVTEAPASVTIVTSDDIRKFGYRTLVDVLRSVRGFFVTYDRNYAYLGVRGFGRPGDYNSRVLLMVDGHPINDNIYDTAPIGTEFILDVDLIDRIEISRGPSSSLYGSNAFFGVIDVITKSGDEPGRVEVSGEAGSFGTSRGRLSYGALREGASVLLSGTAYDSSGQDLYFAEFDPAAPNADPGATNNGIAAGADRDRSSSGFAKATYGDFTLAGASVYRRKVIPTGSFKTLFNTKDTFSVDEHRYAELKYGHAIDPQSSLAGRLAYDEFRYYGNYVSDRAVSPAAPEIVTNRDDVAGKWWSGELTYSRNVRNNTLTFGAAYKGNLAQDQGNRDLELSTTYLDDRRRSHVFALYGQDEVRLEDTLILNAGVRYDHYQTFGDAFNPRLSVIYLPADRTAVKFLYGKAFRAPNAYELYYSDGGFTAKPNPDLKPETIDTFEAVFEKHLGSRVRAVASLYYYEIENLISLEEDPADGLLQYRNVDQIEARGLEFELEGVSSGGVRADLNAAFQTTEDRRTGEQLTNSPRFLSKFNVSVPLARDRLFAGLEEQYVSGRKTLAGNVAEGYFVTNLTVVGMSAGRAFELSAGVYNLFDREFADPASAEHVQDVIIQDGRNYRLKATYRF